MKNFSEIFIIKVSLSLIFLLSLSSCLKQVELEEPVYTVKVEVDGQEI